MEIFYILDITRTKVGPRMEIIYILDIQGQKSGQQKMSRHCFSGDYRGLISLGEARL